MKFYKRMIHKMINLLLFPNFSDPLAIYSYAYNPTSSKKKKKKKKKKRKKNNRRHILLCLLPLPTFTNYQLTVQKCGNVKQLVFSSLINTHIYLPISNYLSSHLYIPIRMCVCMYVCMYLYVGR